MLLGNFLSVSLYSTVMCLPAGNLTVHHPVLLLWDIRNRGSALEEHNTEVMMQPAAEGGRKNLRLRTAPFFAASFSTSHWGGSWGELDAFSVRGFLEGGVWGALAELMFLISTMHDKRLPP